MTATARAQMLRDDDPKQGTLADELADAFCTQARIRADVLSHGLWHKPTRPTADSPST
jgi:hypothetical protein